MGFEVNEIVGAMPSVLNLAAAAQVGLGQSADIVSNIMTGFGISSEDTGKAVDVLVKTMTTANTDLPMLGEAMKNVAPLASSLGWGIEETAAAIATMSNAGIQGAEAGTALRGIIASLIKPVGEGADAIEDLSIQTKDAEGNFKSMPDIIGEVTSKFEHLTEAQKAEYAAAIVGREGVSGFLSLLKEGQGPLEDYIANLENAGGTAERVAKTQMDTLLGSFQEFQSALEGLGISIGNEFLPVFREIVEAGTDLVRMFSDLNPATVTAGIAGVGAAAGIALIATSAIKLVGAMRLLFVSLGPTGWLITGISLLSGVLVGASVETKALAEQSIAMAEAKFTEIDALQKTTAEYEGLRVKLRLSSDELGRFLDINSELAQTANPEVIARLKDEQEKLREKSGLTNEQMSRLVDLNGDLIEKVPEATTKITEQGNALLDNTDAIKKYTDEQLKSLRITMENNILAEEGKQADKLREQEDVLRKINNLELEQNDKIAFRDTLMDNLKTEEQTLAGMKAESNKYSDIEIQNQQTIVDQLGENIELETERIGKLATGVNTKQKELDKINEELRMLDEAKQKLVQLELRQAGINAKKGEGVALVDKEIGKLETEKKKLHDNTSAADRKTVAYRDAVSAIDGQIGKLNTVKSRVQEITGEAGVMNRELSADIQKQVNITTTNRTRQIIEQGRPSATGPQAMRHNGGPLPKFHNGGSPALMQRLQSAPMHNEIDARLLRDEMVLTSAQQSNLFRMIDAGLTQQSAGSGAELSSLVTALSGLSDRPIQLAVNVDGYQVAEASYPFIDMKLAQNMRDEARTNGVKLP